MDDLQAVLRLKSGDINGLEFLISKYQVKAVRIAYLVTHNRCMAEDVVQDAFVHFYERVRQFDEGRLFEPYFMVSVMNAFSLENQQVDAHNPPTLGIGDVGPSKVLTVLNKDDRIRIIQGFTRPVPHQSGQNKSQQHGEGLGDQQ